MSIIEPTYDQLRAKARAQGLRITSKGGGFTVVDPGNNTVIAGERPNPYSLSASEARDFLSEVN